MFKVMDMDGRELSSGFDSHRAAIDYGDKRVEKGKSFRVKGDRGGSDTIDPLFRGTLPRLDAIAKLTMKDFIPDLELVEMP